MPEIKIEGRRILYCSEREKQLLLDLSDFTANKSRLPMHALSDVSPMWELIAGLYQKDAASGEGDQKDAFSALLLDVLLTSHITRVSAPLNILEIGATSGGLSGHLASLLGKLNPPSNLCCVCDVIGNDSENRWLDKISAVEQAPKLSLLIADYEELQLQENFYDIVILNGTDRFNKPYETVKEANRLKKRDGGALFCHVKEQPLLESCFKLVFQNRREYEIDPQNKILVTELPGSFPENEKKPDPDAELKDLFSKLRRAVTEGNSREEIRRCLRRLDACADLAAKRYDAERKGKLLELKDRVLDYMLNPGGEFEAFYREKCLTAIGSED